MCCSAHSAVFAWWQSIKQFLKLIKFFRKTQHSHSCFRYLINGFFSILNVHWNVYRHIILRFNLFAYFFTSTHSLVLPDTRLVLMFLSTYPMWKSGPFLSMDKTWYSQVIVLMILAIFLMKHLFLSEGVFVNQETKRNSTAVRIVGWTEI